MALCLAISLVTHSKFNLYDQLVRYKWWYRDGYMSSTGECFDIGAATSQSLQEFERRQSTFAVQNRIPPTQIDSLSNEDILKQFNVYCSEQEVAGNGALMRLAPVPLFFFLSPKHAVEYSGRSGQITHGDTRAYDACRYYGALIVAALQGCRRDELLDDRFYSKHEQWFGKRSLCPEIREIADGSYKKKGGYKDGIRGKGYIVSALEAALWAFWSDGNSFEKGALAAVNLGDDTDTTAAIYGQLAGAYYGYNKLPKHWLKHIYAKKFIMNLSKWITYEGQKWQPSEDISPFIPSVPPQPPKKEIYTNESQSNVNLAQSEDTVPELHSAPYYEREQDPKSLRRTTLRSTGSGTSQRQSLQSNGFLNDSDLHQQSHFDTTKGKPLLKKSSSHAQSILSETFDTVPDMPRRRENLFIQSNDHGPLLRGSHTADPLEQYIHPSIRDKNQSPSIPDGNMLYPSSKPPLPVPNVRMHSKPLNSNGPSLNTASSAHSSTYFESLSSATSKPNNPQLVYKPPSLPMPVTQVLSSADQRTRSRAASSNMPNGRSTDELIFNEQSFAHPKRTCSVGKSTKESKPASAQQPKPNSAYLVNYQFSDNPYGSKPNRP